MIQSYYWQNKDVLTFKHFIDWHISQFWIYFNNVQREYKKMKEKMKNVNDIYAWCNQTNTKSFLWA